jgi:hypothetical protein
MTDAELEDLKAGLAGVTPGPWQKMRVPGSGDEQVYAIMAQPSPALRGFTMPIAWADEPMASHILRCSPDKIAALIARLEAAEGAKPADATFEVHQDGTPVAMASGPRERALAEAMHYAAVYGQDGPVEVFEHVPVPLPTPPAKSEG